MEQQQWSNGAVAGPLAGVRAPQWVSAPPSSGLAALPLWPEPGEQCPRLGPFFSPRVGVTATLRSGEVGLCFPFFPNRIWICLLFSVLIDWDGVRVLLFLFPIEDFYGFRVRLLHS